VVLLAPAGHAVLGDVVGATRGAGHFYRHGCYALVNSTQVAFSLSFTLMDYQNLVLLRHLEVAYKFYTHDLSRFLGSQSIFDVSASHNRDNV
jgi:hypothetical protein